MSTPPQPGSQAWLDLVSEPIIDPERPIIDPHHHLWQRPGSTYVLEDLWGDTGSGHNVTHTVFVECRASYRSVGAERFAGQRDAIFDQWRTDMEAIAACPNVVAKLGGLAMPDNGFGWHARATPATSDEIVSAQRRYYAHMLDCFGVERCMFESNFPVDRLSVSYAVLFNALKKLVAHLPEAAQDQLFAGTAARVYGIHRNR